MITCMIFLILIIILAVISIIDSIIAGAFWAVQLAHIINFSVLAYSSMVAICYKRFFAKRDLLKSDEEEISAQT